MMGCVYCGKTEESIIHGFEFGNYQYWVCIDGCELVFDGVFKEGSYEKSSHIYYCPICGRKLGDNND